jgi:23S rRNA A2030 N6-methylase RlmJ
VQAASQSGDAVGGQSVRLARSGAVQTKRGGLYGSGLAVFNPPWALKAALEEALPFLANLLGGIFGSWHLEWFDGQQ